jgi:Mrp family chromosome partitioning ATPase
MPYEWMLVLVTAVTPTDYSVVALTDAQSMSECYYKSTLVDMDVTREENQEMLCIKLNLQERAYGPQDASHDW